MLRTGFIQNLEVRFTLDDLLSESSSTLGGFTAGLLMHIREDEGKWPGMGLAISLSVPNADGLQMDAGQVDFVIPFSKSFTDELFLDWHLAASYPDDELAFSFASLLGYGITEKLGTFVGLYSGKLADGLSETSISMDVGLNTNPLPLSAGSSSFLSAHPELGREALCRNCCRSNIEFILVDGHPKNTSHVT